MNDAVGEKASLLQQATRGVATKTHKKAQKGERGGGNVVCALQLDTGENVELSHQGIFSASWL